MSEAIVYFVVNYFWNMNFLFLFEPYCMEIVLKRSIDNL